MPRAVVILLTLLLLTSKAAAQSPSSSFTDLQQSLRIGNTVTITTVSGDVTRGVLRHIDVSALTVNVTDGNRQFVSEDILRIDKRTTAKRKGAWLGLAIGAVAGVTVALVDRCDGVGCIDPSYLIPGLGLEVGLVGMGVGALIGAHTYGERRVFSRDAPGPTGKFMKPAERRAGLLVAVRW